MFGKLLSVHEYEIKIENLSKKVETSLIGVHIVFEDQYKIVGEITRIDVNTIECVLVGEFRQNNVGLILLCNMLLLLFIYRVINDKKRIILITIIFEICNIIYYILFGFEIYSINVKMVVIVIIILLFRMISEEYNYEEIEV